MKRAALALLASAAENHAGKGGRPDVFRCAGGQGMASPCLFIGRKIAKPVEFTRWNKSKASEKNELANLPRPEPSKKTNYDRARRKTKSGAANRLMMKSKKGLVKEAALLVFSLAEKI